VDGFIPPLGRELVEFGQIGGEHHLLSADEVDSAFHQIHGPVQPGDPTSATR
jgi:hypothetical protein